MDRVREAIFSALGSVEGFTVADFFAVSGALGLEAYSRGARRVAWVEKERRHVRVLRENLAIVEGFITEPAETRILETDILQAARRLSDWDCDIIFADPPYNPDKSQKGANDLLTDDVFMDWAGDALLIMEQSKHNPLEECCLERWQVDWYRQYGNNNVYFLLAR